MQPELFDLSTQERLDLAGIKIYMVRAWVNEVKRGKTYSEQIYYRQHIIINDLDQAKRFYRAEKNDLQHYTYYKKYLVSVELITPMIHSNSTLATFAADSAFIERFTHG